ncbi:hypothetical protein JWG42_17890, partial [Desulfoprunum benzoelyticum]|uniref:hypothetical protein n=1 Tax=Desulfoprunum benzoelyticum TaxID=1506996 RepID=UPI0019660E42
MSTAMNSGGAFGCGTREAVQLWGRAGAVNRSDRNAAMRMMVRVSMEVEREAGASLAFRGFE